MHVQINIIMNGIVLDAQMQHRVWDTPACSPQSGLFYSYSNCIRGNALNWYDQRE